MNSAMFSRIFAIDSRSLAIFRITMGCVLIGHLFQILPHLEAFFSDNGTLPRYVLEKIFPSPILSLFMIDGSVEWAYILWGFAFISSLCFTLGYYTHLANFCCAVMFFCLHSRNPIIFQAGDRLVILLLYWSCLLPLNHQWSLDAMRNKQSSEVRILSNIPSAGILLQMCCLYFFTAVLKSADSSWGDGSAVTLVLQGIFSEPNRHYLLDYPRIVEILSHGVLHFEFAVPLLLLLPIFQPTLRLLTLVALAAMHLSFMFFLNIGLFSFDCLAGLTLFLPTPFWNYILKTPQHSVPPKLPNTRTVQYIGALLMMTMLYSNSVSSGWIGQSRLTYNILEQTKLKQRWNMFIAPYRYARWYVTIGYLKDGTKVYPYRLTEEDPFLLYPSNWHDVLGDNLWLKVHSRLDKKILYQHYLHYWCNQWNTQYPDRKIDKIELIARLHNISTVPSTITGETTTSTKLFTLSCR